MTVLTNTSFRMAMMILPTLPLFTTTIAAASNVNMRTVANGAGYTSGNAQLTLAASADVFSTSTGLACLVPGSWPTGVTVTLIIPVGTFLSGCGGFGGNGGDQFGTPATVGGPGGPALSALGISGFIFQVQNLGTIRGGGGGGGGGAMVAGPCVCGGQPLIGGGGGGGGEGHNAGGGGGGGSSNTGTNGSAGGNGTTSAAGGGGPGGFNGNPCAPVNGIGGGNGGGYGSAGGASSASGGAAGNSVTGNANIVWIGSTGTRIGPVT